MHWVRRNWLVAGVFLLWQPVWAADPLQFVPEEADFAVAGAQPGRLVDSLLAVLRDEQLRSLPDYQDAFQQLTVRRFLQLVSYAERELGKPGRELVDLVAGDGLVLAGKFGPQPAPILLVVQGRDPALMRRTVELVSEAVEHELARQDKPSQRSQHDRAGLKVTQLGNVYYTVHQATWMLTNSLEVFDYVAPLVKGQHTRSLANSEKWKTAKKSIPTDVVAWAWLDTRPLKSIKAAQRALELPGDIPLIHVFFGRYLDLFNRSDYLTAWLTVGKGNLRLTVHAPAGWKGAALSARAQTPADGQASIRPPIRLPGTIYSSSYYFNPGAFLDQREKLLRPEQRQAFDQFDKNSAKVLLGTRFSELVPGLGSHYRLLVGQPDRQTYSSRPGTILPSFALVLELKDPEKLGQRLEATLRAVALLATFGTRLELIEETRAGVKLIGYRFAETDANRAVQNGLLFNFSPCFAQVGNQFLLCSTLELGRQLIDVCAKESQAKPTQDKPDRVSPGQPNPHEPRGAFTPVVQDVFFWDGIAELLGRMEDDLVVQLLLGRVQSVESAQAQARQLLALIRRLGTIAVNVQMAETQTRLEFHWQLAP